MRKTMTGKRLREEYPSGFSWDELSALSSFAKRTAYVQERLERLGSGSGRVVYAIDDKKVLKVAKNSKGVAQNKEEIQLSDEAYLDDIVAHVYKYSKDAYFLEMERAVPCSKRRFEELVGYPLDEVEEYLAYFGKEILNQKYAYSYGKPEDFEEMNENEFLKELVDMAAGFDVPLPGDFCKITTFGIVKRDGADCLVVVDYGFRGDVVEMYRR